MSGCVTRENIERVLLVIHSIARHLIEKKGCIDIIADSKRGISIDAILSRDELRDLPKQCIEEILNVLEREGRIILFENNGLKIVKPIQLEAIRFILDVLPYIDAKLVITPRRKLKVFETPWLDTILQGLSLTRGEVELLHKFYKELKNFVKWIDTPYKYQVDVWRSILSKAVSKLNEDAGTIAKPIVISAGTGEGKTEAFFLPILFATAISRLKNRRFRTVILYPRKALAEEQLNRFVKYVYVMNKVLKSMGLEPIKIGILDGDTPLTWINIVDIDRIEKQHLNSIEIARNIICPETGRRLHIKSSKALGLVKRDIDLILHLAQEHGINAIYLKHLQKVSVGMLSNIKKVDKPYFECGQDYIDWLLYTKTDYIFDKPDIIITNFESLSTKLMDEVFNDMWKDVACIVVDEAHELYGTRGIHGALIVRRLISRIEYETGHRPLLIISSATITDPKSIAKALAPWAEELEIYDSFNPDYRERKPYEYVYHLFLVPSERITHETATTHVSVYLALALQHHKVLVFTNSRSDAERIARYVIDKSSELEDKRRRGSLEIEVVVKPHECRDDKPCLVSKCAKDFIELNGMKLEANFHHAGLKKDERAKIEKAFRESRINVLAATSTLELGIDIGDVDAVVLHGIPPTIASYHQRAGRAGARGRAEVIHPIVITVIDVNNPRDLYHFAHAEEIVDRKFVEEHERILLEPEHNYIAIVQQALAAALDFLAMKGISLSPSTIATIKLNPSKAIISIDRYFDELMEYGKRAVNLGTDSKFSANLDKVLRNSLYALKRILESIDENKDLLEFIKLSAMKVWGGIDKRNTEEFIKKFVDKVKDSIEGLLEKEFHEAFGLRKVSRLSTFLETLSRLPDAFSTEKLSDRDRIIRILVYEALLRTLDEAIRRTPRKFEEEFDIVYTNILKILDNVVLLVSEFVSTLAGIGSIELSKILNNLNMVSIPVVVGKRSSVDVEIVDEFNNITSEALLDAYIHYPPGHHVVRGNLVFEVKYYHNLLNRLDIPCEYINYDYVRKSIKGIVYPERIDLSIVRADILSVGSKYRRYKVKVEAFGWTDTDTKEYIEPRDYMRLNEEYRKKLRSIDIVFLCPECLKNYIRSWFRLEQQKCGPYYYPMITKENRCFLASIPRYPSIFRHGLAIVWYPYLENSSSKSMVLRCFNCKANLKASTPIRMIPIVIDKALDTISISQVAVGRVTISQDILSVLYAIDRLLFFIDRVPYTIEPMYRVDNKEYVLGYVFKTNGISIRIREDLDMNKIEGVWKEKSVKWKYLYHRVLKKINDLLTAQNSEEPENTWIEKDIDARYLADKIIAILRIVTIAIKFKHEMNRDDLEYIIKTIVGAHISKRKVVYDYKFRVMLYSFINVLSEVLKSYGFNVLSTNRLDEVLSRSIVEECRKFISRYKPLLEDIAKSYVKIILENSGPDVLDRDDVISFLRYTAIHSLLHSIARYVVAYANASIYEIKTACNTIDTAAPTVYELCEGGSGILWSFYELLKRDPITMISKVIGHTAQCPRETYGYKLDAILPIEGIDEVVKTWIKEGYEGLKKIFVKRLGTEMSFGLKLRITRLLNRYDDLIAVLMFRKLVDTIRTDLGLDPLPYEVEYVLKYVGIVFDIIAKDREFIDKLRAIAKLYSREFDYTEAKNFLRKLLSKPTIEIDRESESSEFEIELKRIAIVMEEYACRDSDGCWLCLSLPYCVHTRNVRSLLPYLSKSCLKLLL